MPPDRNQRTRASLSNLESSPYSRPNNSPRKSLPNSEKVLNNYVFSFGKYEGKSFHDVRHDVGYLNWILKNRVYIPKEKIELRKALEDYGYLRREVDEKITLSTRVTPHSSSPTPQPEHSPKDYLLWIRPHRDQTDYTEKNSMLKDAILAMCINPSDKKGQLLPGWTPPDLKSAPRVLKYTAKDRIYNIWITDFDIRKFFPLAGQLYRSLPKLEEFKRVRHTRRHLYHVWALVRDHASPDAADDSLHEFLSRKEDVERLGSETVIQTARRLLLEGSCSASDSKETAQ